MSTPTPVSAFPVKDVSYSYPTSTNAARFKFPAGCFVVNVCSRRLVTKGHRAGEHIIETKAVSGHATEDEAVAVAKLRPEPWAGWSKRKDTP